jgi:endonuclease/exonuclease/phosphatase family metal-dependent hydrolase
VRFASWNLHEGLPDGVEEGEIPQHVHDEIAGLIHDQQIDILAVQELDFGPTQTSTIMATLLRYTELRHQAVYRLSESSFHPGRSTGIGIASRYPLTSIEKIILPNPELSKQTKKRTLFSHDKGILSAISQVPGGPVVVMSAHALPFHVFDEDAANPTFHNVWSRFAYTVDSAPPFPKVVCGDFNTPNRDLLLGQNHLPLSRAIGDRPTFRDLALDDILYSRDLVSRHTSVVSNFSDHAMCVAEFATKEVGHA